VALGLSLAAVIGALVRLVAPKPPPRSGNIPADSGDPG
jgi:hypothetical protein